MSHNGITVAATGTASGPPDRAVLTLGASAVRGDVAAALAAVTGKIEGLISTLSGHGIAQLAGDPPLPRDPDIQTADLSVWPEHNNQGVVSGFRVRNTVRVSTSNLGGLADMIGAAMAALGDLAEMNGLAFEVADRSDLEAQARARAWAGAYEKANQLAALAGTRLGKAVDITETAGFAPGPMPKRAMAMTMADSVPIETGSTVVEVHLIVRFSQFPDDSPAG